MKVASENVLEKKDRVFLAEIEKTHPKADLKASEIEDALEKSFARMHSMGGYFNAERLRQKEIRELLQDPRTLPMAEEVLLDIDSASQLFGDNQALARVYGIKILEMEARDGNPEPLYRVTETLAKELDQMAKAHNKVSKGRDRDLEDLLRIAVKLQDIEELKENPEGVLETLGFDSEFSPLVVRQFDNAIFYPLLVKYGREKASAIVSRAIERSES